MTSTDARVPAPSGPHAGCGEPYAGGVDAYPLPALIGGGAAEQARPVPVSLRVRRDPIGAASLRYGVRALVRLRMQLGPQAVQCVSDAVMLVRVGLPPTVHAVYVPNRPEF